MSLVALFLLASSLPSTAHAIPACEKPLVEIQMKIQAAADNLANYPEPALPGMWPKSREKVECKNSKCKLAFERGVKIAYEPYSFYADSLGLVGYPDIDPTTETSTLASLQWEYGLQKEGCSSHANSHAENQQTHE